MDCQAGVGMMGSTCGGGPRVAADFHNALEESIATHFPGNHCINCMAHSTENIYRCRPPAQGSPALGLQGSGSGPRAEDPWVIQLEP